MFYLNISKQVRSKLTMCPGRVYGVCESLTPDAAFCRARQCSADMPCHDGGGLQCHDGPDHLSVES